MAELAWTPLATEDYHNYLQYLIDTAGESTALRFRTKLFKVTQLLREFPQMYPASGMKKGLRKALINKNISLYYNYDERAGIVYLYRLLHNARSK